MGKAIAKGFVEGGAKVFITDISQEAVDAAAKEISAGSGFCEGLAADVTVAEHQCKGVESISSAAFTLSPFKMSSSAISFWLRRIA